MDSSEPFLLVCSEGPLKVLLRTQSLVLWDDDRKRTRWKLEWNDKQVSIGKKHFLIEEVDYFGVYSDSVGRRLYSQIYLKKKEKEEFHFLVEVSLSEEHNERASLKQMIHSISDVLTEKFKKDVQILSDIPLSSKNLYNRALLVFLTIAIAVAITVLRIYLKQGLSH